MNRPMQSPEYLNNWKGRESEDTQQTQNWSGKLWSSREPQAENLRCPLEPEKGKKTVLPCVRVCVFVCSVTPTCPTPLDPMDCNIPGFSACPWYFPDKNTGICCYSLLQGIFPTQGSIKPPSLASPALAGGFFTTPLSRKPPVIPKSLQKECSLALTMILTLVTRKQ